MKALKLKEKLLSIFLVVFSLVYVYITFQAIFVSTKAFHPMKATIIVLGVITLIGVLYFVDRLLKNLEESKLNGILFVAFFLMVVIQMIFVAFLLVSPYTWDYGFVNGAAQDFAMGKKMLSSYFYDSYPNNIGIALLLGYLFEAVGIFFKNITVFRIVGFLFNIFMIDLAIYCTYILIKDIFNKSRATLFIIFMFLVTPFYAYAQFVYTDTITMVFPVFAVLLLHYYLKSDSNKKYLYLVAIGFVECVGTILKTNIVISLIAILIYLIFTRSIKEWIKAILLICIPFVLTTSMFKFATARFIPVSYEEAGLPYTHWIMMGLKEPYGGYNQEDFVYSQKLKDNYGKEKTAEANKDEIKKRLKDYGVKGYMEFLNTKINFTWTDGTYYAPNKLIRSPLEKTKLYTYVVGEKNTFFVYMSQISHVIILIGILLSAIVTIKKPKGLSTCFSICIFGVFLFLILWETRSRYLVCYLPFMIVSAFYGFDKLFKTFDKKFL